METVLHLQVDWHLTPPNIVYAFYPIIILPYWFSIRFNPVQFIKIMTMSFLFLRSFSIRKKPPSSELSNIQLLNSMMGP